MVLREAHRLHLPREKGDEKMITPPSLMLPTSIVRNPSSRGGLGTAIALRILKAA